MRGQQLTDLGSRRCRDSAAVDAPGSRHGVPAADAARGGNCADRDASRMSCSAGARRTGIWIIRVPVSEPATAAGEEQASQDQPHQNGNPGFREHVALLGREITGSRASERETRTCQSGRYGSRRMRRPSRESRGCAIIAALTPTQSRGRVTQEVPGASYCTFFSGSAVGTAALSAIFSATGMGASLPDIRSGSILLTVAAGRA